MAQSPVSLKNALMNIGEGAGALAMMARFQEIDRRVPATVLNVRESRFAGGAVGDYSTNDTAAFNAVTAALRAAYEGTPVFSSPVTIEIPPGFYMVDSWDLTELLVFNLQIKGHGAVLVSNEAGKAIIDCVGSRYIQFHGLMTLGTAAARPRCGFQLGPKGTETCGNNMFIGVQTIGEYSLCGLLNAGSETTSHFHCRYINRYENAASYACIADGLGVYLPESDYATITRTSLQAVSFTANAHFATQFRHEAGGEGIFLANTAGWEFMGAGYFLVFHGAAIRLYGTDTYRNSNLNITGLFEANQDNVPSGSGNIGMQYCIALDGDDTNTAIEGFRLTTTAPNAAVSLIHKDTTGTVRMSNAQIRVEALNESGATFFSGETGLTFHGDIETRDAASLNWQTLTAFTGRAAINDRSALPGLPPAGAFTLLDTTASLIDHVNVRELSFQSAGTLTSLTSTTIPMGASSYITINLAGPSDVTDITTTAHGGHPIAIVRNAGAALTFKHNTSKLRCTGGADAVVGTNEAIMFLRVSANIWQQIAGAY